MPIRAPYPRIQCPIMFYNLCKLNYITNNPNCKSFLNNISSDLHEQRAVSSEQRGKVETEESVSID